MTEVVFSVLINDDPIPIPSLREKIVSLALQRFLPSHTPPSAFNYYRMRTPVPLDDLDDSALVQACAIADNRIPFDPARVRVGELAEELSDDYVYVVVDDRLADDHHHHTSLASDNSPGSRKRTAEEASVLDWFVSGRFGKLDPSSINFDRYMALQRDPKERILDGRVPEGTECHPEVPPIPLIYEPFGTFIDTYLHTSTGHNATATSLSLISQVDDFADKMAQIYDDEDARRDDALKCLNNLFRDAFGSPLSPIQAAGFGKYWTDGHVLGPQGIPILIVECENEESGINAIPIMAICGYYHQFMARVGEDLQLSSRMPALGLTIVGPVITFYALAFVGQIHYTSLTSSISCLYHAVNGNERQKLYNAFAAAAVLIHQITQDALSTKPLSKLKNHLYPAITELPSFEDPSKSINFEIISQVHSASGQFLYLATSSANSLLVIKFTTASYSTALHAYCAHKGHAPRLHAYAKLPGGIIGVAMDAIYKPEALNEKKGSLADQTNWANQLTSLVKSFHAEGYVHGDLRSPNVLIANNKVMLIGFDWGGKEGEVFYTHGHLNSQLHKHSGMITREDDNQVLAITLKEIGINSEL